MARVVSATKSSPTLTRTRLGEATNSQAKSSPAINRKDRAALLLAGSVIFIHPFLVLAVRQLDRAKEAVI
jgi:hypothetical protein